MIKPGDIVELNSSKGEYSVVIDMKPNGKCIFADKEGNFYVPTEIYDLVKSGEVDVSSFVNEIRNKIEAVRKREANKREAAICLEKFLNLYCAGASCRECAFSDGILCCVKAVIERELK